MAIVAILAICRCYTLFMRVMGIDCGSEYTGYGVVEQLEDRELICCTSGAIKLGPRDAMASRLQKIFAGLTAVIAEHRRRLSPLRTSSML